MARSWTIATTMLCGLLVGCAASGFKPAGTQTATAAPAPQHWGAKLRTATPAPSAPAPAPLSTAAPPASVLPPSPTPPVEPKAPEPVPDVRVEVEAPYVPTAVPRQKGRVAAAGDDEQLARWNMGGNSDPEYPSSRAGFHPGARVVVDVDIKSRGLPKRPPVDRRTGRSRSKLPSEHGLLAHARKWGYWDFRICFEAALRKDPLDHGQTKLRMRIAANGKVSRVKLLSSELKDKDAARCLEEQVANYRDFRPAPQRRVDLELSIKLWPGDAPLPAISLTDEAVIEKFREANPGEIADEAFLATVNRALDDVRRCYARGIERDAALWGRILLEVQIPPEGGVAKVRQNGSQFPDRKVVRCVRRALRAQEFPRPEGGRTTRMVGLRLGEQPPPATQPTE